MRKTNAQLKTELGLAYDKIETLTDKVGMLESQMERQLRRGYSHHSDLVKAIYYKEDNLDWFRKHIDSLTKVLGSTDVDLSEVSSIHWKGGKSNEV